MKLPKLPWMRAKCRLKILYLSCHSILEHDEVSLLRELGHHVFTPGDYVSEQNPGRPSLRQGLRKVTAEEEADLRAFNSFGKHGPANKDCLIRTFVDRFDVVIVMHLPHWITQNWEAMKHKHVIWRTIGQSSVHIERQLKPYRDQGLKILRYSPLEKNIPDYLGADAVIRFYKDPAEYKQWTGRDQNVITISQHMPARADACHYDVFLQATEPFNTLLYGPGNEKAGKISAGEASYEQLKEALRQNRCYFYTGTFPASYTLSFIEAWMTGIPIVALGQNLMHDRFGNEHLYEVPSLIQNGKDGLVADTIPELQAAIRSLMNDPAHARRVSKKGRRSAIRHFGKKAVARQWEYFLNKVTRE